MVSTNILDIYKYSATKLLNAMKLSIKLIDINRKLVPTNSSNINIENKINVYIYYASEKKRIEELINEEVNQSCKSVILILGNDYLSTDYIRLIQELLSSITNFINKVYIKEFINLSQITVELVSVLNIYDSIKIDDKPQYQLIVKKLRELYQLCIDNKTK